MTITEQRLYIDPAIETDLDVRFQNFHAAHPEVFEALARIALRRLDAGAKYISLKWLFEVLRTDPTIQRDKESVVKLNNSYTSRYARRLVAVYPELGAVIRMRGLKS